MKNYLKVYNHHIPQRNIDHLTPIQKLKEWRLKRPNLFKKRFMIYRDLTNNDKLLLEKED